MKSIFFILYLLISNVTVAQKIDTLNILYTKYSSSTTELVRKYNRTITIYKLGYLVLGKDSIYSFVYDEVDKAVYKNNENRMVNFSKCRPCWQRRYNENGIVESEGLMYTDCRMGIYKEYYKNGVLKFIAQHKKNTDDKLTQCSIREGEWIYFSENGQKMRIEKYKDDILIDTINL